MQGLSSGRLSKECPWGTFFNNYPRIFDEDVVQRSLGSVSNGEDAVVELGAASSGDDTTGVSLEDELVGLFIDMIIRFNEKSLIKTTKNEKTDRHLDRAPW